MDERTHDDGATAARQTERTAAARRAEETTGRATRGAAEGTTERPAGSSRRHLIEALLGLNDELLAGLEIRFHPGGGARVTLHDHTPAQATALLRAFKLSARPDGVLVAADRSDAVAVRYSSGAHLSGGVSVTWVIDGASATLAALTDTADPAPEA